MQLTPVIFMGQSISVIVWEWELLAMCTKDALANWFQNWTKYMFFPYPISTCNNVNFYELYTKLYLVGTRNVKFILHQICCTCFHLRFYPSQYELPCTVRIGTIETTLHRCRAYGTWLNLSGSNCLISYFSLL